MTPVIERLRSNFAGFPLPTEEPSSDWVFREKLEALSQNNPTFYNKIIRANPELIIEYGLLRQQLKKTLDNPGTRSIQQVTDQLTAALMMAELLEYLHDYYLITPAEVIRFRAHQKLYKKLLSERNVYVFPPREFLPQPLIDPTTITNFIREKTGMSNWLRQLIARYVRFLSVLAFTVVNTSSYNAFIQHMNKFTGPFFSYLSWCFFIPRLTANLVMIIGYTLPHSALTPQQKSLDLNVRLLGQLQGRWFEVGNDLVWLLAGILNCFFLIGPLAPIALYVTIGAFAFDVFNSGLRAVIELGRLYRLKQDYTERLIQTDDLQQRRDIEEHLEFLDQRLEFEAWRAGLHFAGTMFTVSAMFLAIPALAINPVVPLIGAIVMVLLVVALYKISQDLESQRPNDTLEQESALKQLSFFAKKDQVLQNDSKKEDMEYEPSNVLCSA